VTITGLPATAWRDDPEPADLGGTGDGERIEHDVLGPRSVPADALWGIHTLRSVEALSWSGRRLGDLAHLPESLGAVKVAAAWANGRAGVLEEPVARVVADAAGELVSGAHRDALVVDPLGGGGAIGVHVNVNEVVANLANRRLGGPLGAPGPVAAKEVVGASQSTADVVHTASRLAVLAAADGLARSAGRALAALDDVGRRFAGEGALARTCLRDGLAVPARLLPDGAAAAIRRRSAVLVAGLGPLHEVVLGSTVVGTGAGAPRAYRDAVVPLLAEVTGRALRRSPDPASRLQHGDDLGEVASAVAHLARAWAKVARDLRLLGSGPDGGLGDLDLPVALEGSTFFPGKANPAVPESVVAAALHVEGLERVVQGATASSELHLHPYDLVAAVAVLDQLRILAAALDLRADHALPGIALRADRPRGPASPAPTRREHP
jgi:aspartate ammonia-lyase